MGTRRQLSWRAVFTLISLFLVSFLVIPYAKHFHGSHFTPRSSAIDGDLEDGAIANLVKKATSTYEEAQLKGRKLHCLMGMTEAEAKAANAGVSLEAPAWLQTAAIAEVEGWLDTTEEEGAEPFHSTYLNDALRGLGIKPEFHTILWRNDGGVLLFDDPSLVDLDGDGDWGDSDGGEPTFAYFQNSFILDPGVIIADKNLGVDEAIKDNLVQGKTTHFRKTKTCEAHGGDHTKVRYIIRSWITNDFTLSTIFQAIINKDKNDGQGRRIGKWADRTTLTPSDHPDEFFAILGSPNGSGSAYFLITHKRALGVKVINKVDIFVPNIPLDVTGTSVNEYLKERKVMLVFHVTGA
ncbi:hypothetical protein FAUST_11862 [Fusarium austroamericanum]|uniref:Uncharacterized protein n=1 Tax=Fusarium austroamericanum TaxID=282268 RepID=A0AAN6BTX9_FUSAU|nr:hypothetical protein FAUST_11862 [Fusarium austroamericanum]